MSPQTRGNWIPPHGVPDYLTLRQGSRPFVVVAPHGGRRNRPIRRGDAVNDLHTAEIAAELAERLDAHAILNHSLDRNDCDLNRITHLTERAPQVLELLAAAIEAAGELASKGGALPPLVLFVHGWNMVVPCCDIGIGLRRRAANLSGRFPTMSKARYESSVAAIERELAQRGVGAAIGRRYMASGRNNAAQLFSGRHAEHENEVVAALGRLSLAGCVDAAQLELGIPLRWSGHRRQALVDGLVVALEHDGPPSPAFSKPFRGWSVPHAENPAEPPDLEPGFSLQAVLDAGGRAATFCGVEATGPHSMTARFSIVCTDGSMMLLVGEGEWGGKPGHYDLEGLSWRSSVDGRHIEITLRGSAIRYPTHEAYLDLESGLASSTLVDVDVQLVYEANADGWGCLRGNVNAGAVCMEVDQVAFVDRGGRRSGSAGERLRVATVSEDGAVHVVKSVEQNATLEMRDQSGGLGVVRALAAPTSGTLSEATVISRVPVWRPLGDGVFARWSFGLVRCRFHGSSHEAIGLFERLEVFRRPPQTVADSKPDATR